MPNRKILAAAAMAGALTVGGALGVALGTPGVSGAEKGTTATTTTAPAKDGPGKRGPGGGFRHGPGGGVELEAAAKAIGISVEDLRSALKDGKSIAEVAKDKGVARQKVIDAMVKAAEARLDEAKKALPDRIADVVDGKFKGPQGKGPDGGGPPGHRGGRGFLGNSFEAAAKAIGVSVEDLRTALKDGKSIAEVAKDKGVAEQKVIDAIVKAAKDDLAAAVKDGKLDQARADEIEKDLPDHAKHFVEMAFGGGPGMGHGRPGGFGPGGPGGPGHGPGGPEGD
jgi:uncharacterized protein (DUF433 family)